MTSTEDSEHDLPANSNSPILKSTRGVVVTCGGDERCCWRKWSGGLEGSADLQSAVSQNCILRAIRMHPAGQIQSQPAYHPARFGNQREWNHGRLLLAVYSYIAKSPVVEQISFKQGSVPRMSTSRTYEFLNRLRGFVTTDPQSASLSSFAYVHNRVSAYSCSTDWMSRRIAKKVWDNPAGTGSPTNSLVFVYDGWNLVAVLGPRSTVLRSFTWGLDLRGSLQGAGGVGGLLAISHRGTQTNFAAFDGNGNVASLVNAADGKNVAQYEYGPFGEVIRATGPMAKVNPFRWSTQYQDDETDLVMYLRRPYSPSTGRWLSRDPIQEQGGLNLYGFVGNNPISRFDVLGLWWSNIHHDATKRWAIADGYPSDAAETIATWDELVDHGINASWPIFGDQSYHFNRNRFGGPDTRLVHYTDHLGTAKRFCTASLGYDLPVPAAMQLGTGLHPLQDWVAHGDFGMHMDSICVVHNGFSPQKEYGSPGNYPDMTWLDAVGTPDGRATSAVIHVINNAGFDYARFEPGIKRWTLTKQLTDSALAEFLGHVRNYGGCKCKNYFGVQ